MSDNYYTELREYAVECKSKQWELRKWTKQPALIDKKRTEIRLYTGQQYDPKYYEVDPQGWDHDHCEFCFVTICNCEHNECCNEGYTDDRTWICPDCFQHLVVNSEDPEEFLKSKMDNS